MTVHARRVLALLLLLCTALPVSALAQTETGTITGTVTDQSNAVLPGVAVTLTSRALIGGSRPRRRPEQARTSSLRCRRAAMT